MNSKPLNLLNFSRLLVLSLCLSVFLSQPSARANPQVVVEIMEAAKGAQRAAQSSHVGHEFKSLIELIHFRSGARVTGGLVTLQQLESSLSRVASQSSEVSAQFLSRVKESFNQFSDLAEASSGIESSDGLKSAFAGKYQEIFGRSHEEDVDAINKAIAQDGKPKSLLRVKSGDFLDGYFAGFEINEAIKAFGAEVFPADAAASTLAAAEAASLQKRIDELQSSEFDLRNASGALESLFGEAQTYAGSHGLVAGVSDLLYVLSKHGSAGREILVGIAEAHLGEKNRAIDFVNRLTNISSQVTATHQAAKSAHHSGAIEQGRANELHAALLQAQQKLTPDLGDRYVSLEAFLAASIDVTSDKTIRSLFGQIGWSSSQEVLTAVKKFRQATQRTVSEKAEVSSAETEAAKGPFTREFSMDTYSLRTVGIEDKLLRVKGALKEGKHVVISGKDGAGRKSVLGLAAADLGIPIRELDAGTISAGTMYRGSFGLNVKNAIAEVVASVSPGEPVVLLISDAEEVINLGKTDGSPGLMAALAPLMKQHPNVVLALITRDAAKVQNSAFTKNNMKLVSLDEISRLALKNMASAHRRRIERELGVRFTDSAFESVIRIAPKNPVDVVELLTQAASLSAVRVRDRNSLLELEDKMKKLTQTLGNLSGDDAQKAYLELERIEAELAREKTLFKSRYGDTVYRNEVTDAHVGEAYFLKTGIQVVVGSKEEAGRLLGFADALREKLAGQDHVIEPLARLLANWIGVGEAGSGQDKMPLFLALLGYRGSGKSYTIELIRELLFPGQGASRQILISVPSEIASGSGFKHTLFGTRDNPGPLKRFIVENQHVGGVIGLDEMEKAGMDRSALERFLLTALQEGKITIHGESFSLRGFVFIGTSNLAEGIRPDKAARAIKELVQEPSFRDPEISNAMILDDAEHMDDLTEAVIEARTARVKFELQSKKVKEALTSDGSGLGDSAYQEIVEKMMHFLMENANDAYLLRYPARRIRTSTLEEKILEFVLQGRFGEALTSRVSRAFHYHELESRSMRHILKLETKKLLFEEFSQYQISFKDPEEVYGALLEEVSLVGGTDARVVKRVVRNTLVRAVTRFRTEQLASGNWGASDGSSRKRIEISLRRELFDSGEFDDIGDIFQVIDL